MLADGAERCNLAGETVGAVTDAEREHAAGKLAKRMETLARLANENRERHRHTPVQRPREAPVEAEASQSGDDDAPKAPKSRPILTLAPKRAAVVVAVKKRSGAPLQSF